MVGSVLLDRMKQEGDFSGLEPHFFSTSQAGQPGPDVGAPVAPLGDANDCAALEQMDTIITCQGGDYTKGVHPELRASGWPGYWIDAASALRMEESSVIVLDPVNRALIDDALERGVRDFIGGNCTVSLMVLAMAGIIRKGWVEWISSMTYQSASGAGARQVKELITQMAALGDVGRALAADPASAVLDLDRRISLALGSDDFPTEAFGAPLAASLLPWIDRAMDNGQTREEWKGQAEAGRILGERMAIPVDGLCVRVGAMRCHSQALTVRLKGDIPLSDIESALRDDNEWVKVIANDREVTMRDLTPAAVSGTLDIAVGRLRKMTMGPEYLAAFTVGDQLLWGAAEPIRRMLAIVKARGQE